MEKWRYKAAFYMAPLKKTRVWNEQRAIIGCEFMNVDHGTGCNLSHVNVILHHLCFLFASTLAFFLIQVWKRLHFLQWHVGFIPRQESIWGALFVNYKPAIAMFNQVKYSKSLINKCRVQAICNLHLHLKCAQNPHCHRVTHDNWGHLHAFQMWMLYFTCYWSLKYVVLLLPTVYINEDHRYKRN